MSRLGHHYIAELWGCPAEVLDDGTRLREFFHDAAKTAQVTVLNSQFHNFEPQGVTGILLLSESHLSFHTWPEHGYCALDFFTCSSPINARNAVFELASRMAATKIDLKVLGRGDLRPMKGPDIQRVTLYPPFQWTPAEEAHLDELPGNLYIHEK